MTPEEITNSFNQTFDTWDKALGNYTNSQFVLTPDQESWSIGQVYQHLITVTKRIFLQIDKCIEGDANEHEQKTDAGVNAFKNSKLGDIKVKVPVSI